MKIFNYPAYQLFKINENYRVIIRNHWSDNFNDSFIFILGKNSQSFNLDVYRFGLFNFCLCLMHNKKD
jgi:hypothetical protein